MNRSFYLYFLYLYFFLGAPLMVYGDPWGKDADLVSFKPISRCVSKREGSILTSVGEKMIKFHQEVISPADGPRSHYIPSSSQYTLEAMKKYGFFQGYCLGCDRLMRENSDPWVYQKIRNPAGEVLKWNPVPKRT